ncbi:hypothetical protein ACFL1R_06240 [Candidatus Latescibacterota bacterium]
MIDSCYNRRIEIGRLDLFKVTVTDNSMHPYLHVGNEIEFEEGNE